MKRHADESQRVVSLSFFEATLVSHLPSSLMKMEAHKIEVVLTEDGTLMLQGLPFHAGDAVEVIILSAKTPQLQGAAPSHLETNLYPMRGKVIRYDDPTEPVAFSDWGVLQ